MEVKLLWLRMVLDIAIRHNTDSNMKSSGPKMGVGEIDGSSDGGRHWLAIGLDREQMLGC